MGGDEEAHHPSLICMSLSHHSVPQEMILKHQGIEKLRITFILYLYPGNGEYGNDIFPLRAAALAVLIEVIDDEILNPCPAALLLIPIDSIAPNIDSIANNDPFHAVKEHCLLHRRVAHECDPIGIAGQRLQSGKAQRGSGFHF